MRPFLLILLIGFFAFLIPALIQQHTIGNTRTAAELAEAVSPNVETENTSTSSINTCTGGQLPAELRQLHPSLLTVSAYVQQAHTLPYSSSLVHAATGTEPVRILQMDELDIFLSDGQFVWGPNAAEFDIQAFLQARGSDLVVYAADINIWASYTSVNPRVLLAFLELDQNLISRELDSYSREQILEEISTAATDLAITFYEHLYAWGSRKNEAMTPTASGPPAVILADGTAVQITTEVPSGTFAVTAALARERDLDHWMESTSKSEPASFSAIFGGLFPDIDATSGENDINPPAAPPDTLLQFPYPLGATWYVSGAHSWAGGGTPPPFSSIDFFYESGHPCSDPPDHYIVAAAYGSAMHPSDYPCWIEVDHGDGWSTSYYHLMNTYPGGTMGQNGSLGTISCEICAGGFATGPHVHFSLKYNGAYMSVEGLKLSGWTVHIGEVAYYSGYLERDGVIMDAYSRVMNDYHLYYERPDLSLRFYGNTAPGVDRVKIRLHDYPRPVDVGTSDFTIEWWLKADPGDNSSPSCTTGADNWILGNILFDRRVQGDDGQGFYGISLAGGTIAFGVDNGTTQDTLCGSSSVDDGSWHHIAVTRTVAGAITIFVDGIQDATMSGPAGDISYADSRYAVHADDVFLVIGADKFDSDPALHPPFKGWMDEVRFSNTIRYSTDFSLPTEPFTTDANTVGLYGFNEGERNTNWDASGYPGGPANGSRRYGGDPAGPEWSLNNPFDSIFADVPIDHWAHDNIVALYNAGYISGCEADPSRLYCPDNTMTRAESAVFVERGVHGGGYNPPTPTEVLFTDVPIDMWYASWATALYNEGYTAGCETDPLQYCPDQTHMRAEGTVFYLRMLNGPAYVPPEASEFLFADVPDGVWYTDWVYAAYTAGIALPCETEPELLFCPEDPLKRDVAAYMMVQAKGGLPLGD